MDDLDVLIKFCLWLWFNNISTVAATPACGVCTLTPQSLAPSSSADTAICESDLVILHNFMGFSPSKITKQALVGDFYFLNLDPSYLQQSCFITRL